jgi:hypothetical protein
VPAAKNADHRCYGLILLFVISGCTFIGIDNPALRSSIEWDPPQAVPTCVYLDQGVSREDADQLLGWWNNREGRWYKLLFVAASYEPLKRDSDEFFSSKLPPGWSE